MSLSLQISCSIPINIYRLTKKIRQNIEEINKNSNSNKVIRNKEISALESQALSKLDQIRAKLSSFLAASNPNDSDIPKAFDNIQQNGATMQMQDDYESTNEYDDDIFSTNNYQELTGGNSPFYAGEDLGHAYEAKTEYEDVYNRNDYFLQALGSMVIII